TLRVRHANAACARLFVRDSMAAFDLSTLKGEGLLEALRAPLAGQSGAYDGPYSPGNEPPAGWVQLRPSPGRGSNGKAVGGIALFVDVTERHRLEEQLRQAHRLEAVGRLAGGMAHDIDGLLDTLRESAEHGLAVSGPADRARVDLAEVKRIAERVSG